MRTLDRYLIGVFTKNFLMAILALSSLVVFQAFLGDLFDNQYPPSQTIYYRFLDWPNHWVEMTGPAVLLAMVLTLSGLTRTNELIACFSIGVGLRRITTLLMMVVLMVSCLTLVLEDRILPATFRTQTVFYYREMQKKPDFYLDIKQDKIWYRSKNMIYNLQRFDARSRTIHGMSVYTFDDDFNLVQAINAERAEYTPSGWVLRTGDVTVFTRDNQFPLTQNFAEKSLLIAETPTDFQEIDKEVNGLRLKQLYQYIEHMRNTGADTKSYEVKFHSRISLSFIPLVMGLMGVPFSVRNRREGGTAKDLGLCLGVTFFYWLFYSIGLSLGTNGALPPWVAAWLPSGIFTIVAVTLVLRRR